MKKLKTVFFGTPDFSLSALELLHNHPLVDLIGVVSMPDRPKGRGQQLVTPPVAQYAKDHKIFLIQSETINKDSDVLNLVSDCDLIIVLAFAQFMGTKLLDAPKIGAFNIHTSLLPRYRGAAPIQYALLNGDSSTGVSIQKMVKKMDAGDLVYSHEIKVRPFENLELLSTRLKFLAAISLEEFIKLVLSNQLTFTPQDESLVSFAHTIKKEDGFLDFKSLTVVEATNKLRAFGLWPGVYCYLNQKRLKIINFSESSLSIKPGGTNISQNQLHVGLRDGSLRLETVQLEGKRPCSDLELLRGLSNNKDRDLILNP